MADSNKLEMIGRYLNGQMRPEEQSLFQQKLGTDPELRKMMDAEELIRSTIRHDLAAMPSGHMATRMRVMDMLAKAPPPRGRHPRRNRRRAGNVQDHHHVDPRRRHRRGHLRRRSEKRGGPGRSPRSGRVRCTGPNRTPADRAPGSRGGRRRTGGHSSRGSRSGGNRSGRGNISSGGGEPGGATHRVEPSGPEHAHGSRTGEARRLGTRRRGNSARVGAGKGESGRKKARDPKEERYPLYDPGAAERAPLESN
jgi:hypothetical protein